MKWKFGLGLLLVLAASFPAHAGSGPLGIDHEWALDQSGIWARKYQTGLEFGVIAVEIGGALWLGNDAGLGHTMWQTVDSSLISGLAADALKRTFGRARPEQGNNPNAWFKGSCCESFPSGEVTLQASFVTPLIVHYARENPWIWGLEVLPVYDAIARMKSQAHWHRRDRRLGPGYGNRLLDQHLEDTAHGADSSRRTLGGTLQKILGLARS